MKNLTLPALLLLSLAACDLPRGAAMQSEILRDSQSEKRSFQVVSLTRNNVAAVAHWPVPPQARNNAGNWPSGGLRNPDPVTIASGDQLTITVWDNDENSLLTTAGQKSTQMTTTTVTADGSVFVPYIGKVRVRGLSEEGARAELQNTLVNAFPTAQVTVAATPGRRNTVDLIGGVGSPGNVPLPDKNFSVLSLISAGGGAQSSLANPQVKLIRGNRTYGIALSQLLDNPALDVSLRGGDKVAVEADKRYFLALGATGTQNTVAFDKQNLSALDAVSMLGGLNAGRANPKGILILREYGSKQVRTDKRGPDRERVVFVVDLTSADGLFSARNFNIRSGDLVMATESPLNNTRTIFGLIGQVFGLANSIDG